MRIIQTIGELRGVLSGHREIGLIPTMGSLHEGHVSLVEIARQHGGMAVASIFVNPLQFAAHEDFATYPRTLERDFELLAGTGCDVVFAPNAKEMYPEPQECTIARSAGIANVLEGHFRPAFFSGVATVVLKLFHIVQPSCAIFGKKDYQQRRVIENMVRQLALPIEIVAAETMRESSGLAMSSRNRYLTATKLKEAQQLHKSLRAAAAAMKAGRSDWQCIERTASELLNERGWRVDYIAIRQRNDLSAPVEKAQLVVLGAAYLGKTRLIDSLEV